MLERYKAYKVFAAGLDSELTLIQQVLNVGVRQSCTPVLRERAHTSFHCL